MVKCEVSYLKILCIFVKTCIIWTVKSFKPSFLQLDIALPQPYGINCICAGFKEYLWKVLKYDFKNPADTLLNI